MDGKGRFLDNIFIERLWRSLKYEEVFIRAYTSVAEARRSIGRWMTFYNTERKHQTLNYRTPNDILRRPGPVSMWRTQERYPHLHRHNNHQQKEIHIMVEKG
jgi:transposase InsO family protein